MHLDMQRILDIMAHNAWVFMRLTGFMLTAPVLSNPLVPARVRIVLLLALTILIAPLVSGKTVALAFDGAGALAVANELLLGAAIGFTVQMAFEALSFAGTMTAMSMGLGFASLVDPSRRGDEPVVGQMYQIIGLLMYLSIDGHLALLATLAESFRWLPPGQGSVAHESLWGLAALGGRIIASGVVVALPAVVALLIVNIALGVVSRAAPQLSLHAVGFPITLMFGLVVLIQALPVLRESFDSLLRESLGHAALLAGAR